MKQRRMRTHFMQNSAQTTVLVASYDVVGFISCRKVCVVELGIYFPAGRNANYAAADVNLLPGYFGRETSYGYCRNVLSKQNHCSRVWYFVSIG